MTYVPPYWIGGALCDYDPDCLMACELLRLVAEADSAPTCPVITEDQDYE